MAVNDGSTEAKNGVVERPVSFGAEDIAVLQRTIGIYGILIRHAEKMEAFEKSKDLLTNEAVQVASLIRRLRRLSEMVKGQQEAAVGEQED